MEKRSARKDVRKDLESTPYEMDPTASYLHLWSRSRRGPKLPGYMELFETEVVAVHNCRQDLDLTGKVAVRFMGRGRDDQNGKQFCNLGVHMPHQDIHHQDWPEHQPEELANQEDEAEVVVSDKMRRMTEIKMLLHYGVKGG